MSEKFNLLFISFFRKSTTKFLVIIFALFSLIIVIVSSYFASMKSVCEAIENVKSFRMLEIYFSDPKERDDFTSVIMDNSHVQNVIPAVSYSLKVSAKEDNLHNQSFLLYASNNTTLPRTKVGKIRLKDNSFELICPQDFLSKSNYDISNTHKKKSKDMELIFTNHNQNITESKNFKIVGFYDDENFLETTPICFTDNATMFELTKDLYPKENYNIILEVDSIDNCEKLKSELNASGKQVQNVASVDIEKYRRLLDSSDISVGIYILVFTIIVFIATKIEYKKNLEDLRLFYFLGFSTEDISKNYLLANLLVWLTSISLALITVGIIDSIICNVFNICSIVINYDSLIYSAVLFLTIVLINTYYNIKKIREVDSDGEKIK